MLSYLSHRAPGLEAMQIVGLSSFSAHTAIEVGSIAPRTQLKKTPVMEKALVQGHPFSKADLHPDSLTPESQIIPSMTVILYTT